MKTQKVEIDCGQTGAQLVGILTAPDEQSTGEYNKTLVIFLHDLPDSNKDDHNGFYGYLCNVFDEHGLQTLTFDFEGFGESDGERETFTLETAEENMKAVLEWAYLRGFEKFQFVACGCAAALALKICGKTTNALFFFWPVVDLALHARKLTEAGNDNIHQRGRERPDLLESMKQFNPQKIMREIRAPVLIQYGAKDRFMDFEQTETIRRSLKAPRIEITSYDDGDYGLPDPRHRKMAGKHIGLFLEKYAR